MRIIAVVKRGDGIETPWINVEWNCLGVPHRLEPFVEVVFGSGGVSPGVSG